MSPSHAASAASSLSSATQVEVDPIWADPLTLPADDDPGHVDVVPSGLVQTLLATVALWCSVHAVFAVVATRAAVDSSTLWLVALDVLGSALSGAALIGVRQGRGRPGLVPALLAAVAALAALRGAAIGQPFLGLDAGVVLVAAALVVDRDRLRWIAAAVAVLPAALCGYGITRDMNSSTPGALGAGLDWLYVVVALGVSAAVAFAVRAIVDQLDLRARAAGVAAPAGVRDILTGLTNRAGLDLVATPMIEHARRSGQAVHCLYLDIDGLRAVNESTGLAAGDSVLREVSRIVGASVRATDAVARWSGDEIVVIGPGTGMSPLELERRVRAQIVTDPPVPIEVWAGRVSIGSATLVPWDAGGLAELIAKSEEDMLMRRALRRRAGRPSANPTAPRQGERQLGHEGHDTQPSQGPDGERPGEAGRGRHSGPTE